MPNSWNVFIIYVKFAAVSHAGGSHLCFLRGAFVAINERNLQSYVKSGAKVRKKAIRPEPNGFVNRNLEPVTGGVFGGEVVLFAEAYLCREMQGVFHNRSPFVGCEFVELVAGDVVLDEPVQYAGIESIAGSYGAHRLDGVGIKVAMPVVAE